jgi:hypothetical protein
MPFGSAVTSITKATAAVRMHHGPTNAIALLIILAVAYCVVDTGRLRTNRWTLSLRSCTTALITRKMFRITITQMSDTPPT